MVKFLKLGAGIYMYLSKYTVWLLMKKNLSMSGLKKKTSLQFFSLAKQLSKHVWFKSNSVESQNVLSSCLSGEQGWKLLVQLEILLVQDDRTGLFLAPQSTGCRCVAVKCGKNLSQVLKARKVPERVCFQFGITVILPCWVCYIGWNRSDCERVFLSVRSLEIIYPNSPHIKQLLISTIFFSCFSESSTASALVA